jgi:O-antigen ligase
MPLLKDTWLIGHGADTYPLYFPQNDYVGKYNAGWIHSVVVDKPHNMFLGMFVGAGGLSLLALLALWGIYIVQSFRVYWREKYEDFTATAGAGIFFGICGFLVSGLVNDSSVSVMPLFYGLLGTGVAINLMLKRRRKQAQAHDDAA